MDLDHSATIDKAATVGIAACPKDALSADEIPPGCTLLALQSELARRGCLRHHSFPNRTNDVNCVINRYSRPRFVMVSFNSGRIEPCCIPFRS